MTPPLDMALIGATGLMGEAILDVLAEAGFPVGRLYALASQTSEAEGATVTFRRRELAVEEAEGFDFSKVRVVILAAPIVAAPHLARLAQSAGAQVIDLSRAVDNAAFTAADGIAVGLSTVLQPLLALSPTAVEATGMVPVSCRGRKALAELADQTTALFNQQDMEHAVFSRRLAFNVLPQTDEQGAAVAADLSRLLGEEAPATVQVGLTVVPVFFGATLRLTLTFAHPTAPDALLAAWQQSELLQYLASPALSSASDCAGQARITLSGVSEISPYRLAVWVQFDPVRQAALHVLRLAARVWAES